MKLITLVILNFALPFASEAALLPSAANYVLQKEIKNSIASKAQGFKTRDAQDCADFSGNWEGTCEARNEKFAFKMKVQQEGCKRIIVDSNDFAPGTNKTEATAGKVFAQSVGGSKFSPDGQMVNMYLDMFIDSQEFDSPLQIGALTVLRKAGEKLQMLSLFKIGSTGVNGEPLQSICELAKAP